MVDKRIFMAGISKLAATLFDMKKSIRPPENWQDFETLCKKLFGEIWGCSNTIMKNGRLGQLQAGVDVYGKPKGENEYWGIQCKGKDNYSKSKLTKKEIDEEITKALNFKPPLKTFIFATTAQKDVEIEEYIRLKDTESCSSGKFAIAIYSWQDVADLIEENRETFNWYVNEQQFKSAYDVEIIFPTEDAALILKPTFLKTTKEYVYKSTEDRKKLPGPRALSMMSPMSIFTSTTNKSWCDVIISVTNIGGVVIEDWKIWLTYSNDVQKIDDDFPDNFGSAALLKNRTTWAYHDSKQILCEPLGNAPLIQKMGKRFLSYCIPHFNAKEVTVKWHLLARDFDKEGEILFKVEPTFEHKKEIFYVDSPDKARTEIEISEYIV